MASELGDNFSKIINGKLADDKLLIPLLFWLSGSEKNIELCQRINQHITRGNSRINILELTLGNNVRHFIKYPSTAKDDKKLKFLYDDICLYLGWTPLELRKNLCVIDLEELKQKISYSFGYDEDKKKLIGGVKK